MNKAEHRLGEDIEDTVKDHLGIREDNVSSIGETPCDRVKQPKKRQDGGGSSEGFLEVGANDTCRSSSGTEQDPPYVEEGETTEDVETPLIGGFDQSSDQTGDDHDEIEEGESDDVGQGKSRCQDQSEEQGRRSDNPINVSHVLDPLLAPVLVVFRGDLPRSVAQHQPVPQYGQTR